MILFRKYVSKIPGTICDICGKEMRCSARVLEAHMRRHREGPQALKKPPQPTEFKCPTCEKLFKSKKSLDSHVENVHNKFPCDLCGVLICSKHKKVNMVICWGNQVIKCFFLRLITKTTIWRTKTRASSAKFVGKVLLREAICNHTCTFIPMSDRLDASFARKPSTMWGISECTYERRISVLKEDRGTRRKTRVKSSNNYNNSKSNSNSIKSFHSSSNLKFLSQHPYNS